MAKKKRDSIISLRITDELHKQIAKLAELDNRTTSSYLNNMLILHVKRTKGELCQK